MVMLVFTLPSFPWVFKVIRDEFPPPKQITREEVRAKYLLVKYHDRVGRLPDAMEYSDVLFPADRMDPAVLAELERSLRAEHRPRRRDRLVVKHLYVERRMTPLDLFLQHADPSQQYQASASSAWRSATSREANIFPGDLLLKNFGITGRGRVVFYDYDEISLLTEVCFRRLPTRAGRGRGVVGRAVVPRGSRAMSSPRSGCVSSSRPGGCASSSSRCTETCSTRRGGSRARRRSAPGRQPDPIPYPDEVRFGQVLGDSATSG